MPFRLLHVLGHDDHPPALGTCRQADMRGVLWLQIYSRLETMATVLPVSGQQDGSYLTMWSSAGLQCAPSPRTSALLSPCCSHACATDVTHT